MTDFSAIHNATNSLTMTVQNKVYIGISAFKEVWKPWNCMFDISIDPNDRQLCIISPMPVKVSKLSIHWDQVTSICVSNLSIIGSENGLSPGRRQVIIWSNAGILLIGPFGTNFSQILIEIQTFPFKNMYLKMSSAKWWPFCLGLKCAKKLGINISHHRHSPRYEQKLFDCFAKEAQRSHL